MKFVLIPLLLVGAGAGWFGLKPAASEECPPPCATEDCRVTVECIDRDTCLVTCYDASDEIVCQREVACEAPCQKTCETPGEASAPAEKAAPVGCQVPCSR